MSKKVAFVDDDNKIVITELEEVEVATTADVEAVQEDVTDKATQESVDKLERTVEQRLSDLENKFTLLCFELSNLGIKFNFQALIQELDNFKGE